MVMKTVGSDDGVMLIVMEEYAHSAGGSGGDDGC